MTAQDFIDEKLCKIEALCATEVGRNITHLADCVKGSLAQAACSVALCDNPHVVLVTGFYVPVATPPAPETDGPPGAVQLAVGLFRAGVKVRLVTDAICAKLLTNMIAATGCDIPLHVVENSVASVRNLIDELNAMPHPVTHCISVERVGPSLRDNHPHNMSGMDVSDYTAPLHLLFAQPQATVSWQTIGIGDGGNEIGMGQLPEGLVAKEIRLGADIGCCVACDYLIVAGVSNWGATSLLAACALVNAGWFKAIWPVLQVDYAKKLLQEACASGAVDGALGKACFSVDGLDWSHHASFIKELLDIVEAG